MLDLQTLLSNAQAVTTGTQLSTNAYDLWNGNSAVPTVPLARYAPQAGGAPLVDPGRGGLSELLVQVVTAFAGGTSLQVKLVQADDAALGTNLVVLQESVAIVEASLVAGYQFRLALPAGFTQRFLGLQYVTVGTHTAGNVTAGLVIDKQTNPFVG